MSVKHGSYDCDFYLREKIRLACLKSFILAENVLSVISVVFGVISTEAGSFCSSRERHLGPIESILKRVGDFFG